MQSDVNSWIWKAVLPLFFFFKEKNSAVQLLVLNESVRKGKLANNQTGVLPFKQLLSRFFIRISLGCKGE